ARGAASADIPLEHDNLAAGIPLLQPVRSPQPDQAAPHDADVGRDASGQRRLVGLIPKRLVKPQRAVIGKRVARRCRDRRLPSCFVSHDLRPCYRGVRRCVPAVDSGLVFTVEQRDDVRERLLQLAEEDERVVAGAAVGSLAVDGGGDRFSDLDLTFGIADHVPVAGVLDDWTTRLVVELDAVTLADLERGLTIYRVFLLPGALQLDLSMTPAAQFRPYG